MRKLLASGVKRVLPSGAARRLEAVYRSGKSKLASARYGNPARRVRVVAVTGSYGKTTTVRLLSELLQEAGHKVHMADTSAVDGEAILLQRQIKDASRAGAEFFVLDVTAPLVQMKAIEAIDFDAVVVTSASPEVETVLKRAKNFAVIPSDFSSDSLTVAQHRVITFGEDEAAEARIEAVTLYRLGTEIQVTIDHNISLLLSTHLIGRANAFNVAGAVATLYVLDVALDSVKEGVARLEGVKGNYEYKKGPWPFKVVVDGAESEHSARLVIGSARELAKRRLIVVLGISNVGEELLREVKKIADRLIVVSTEESQLPGVETFADPKEAWHVASRAGKVDDTVLLVGASFAYSDIVENSEGEEHDVSAGSSQKDHTKEPL